MLSDSKKIGDWLKTARQNKKQILNVRAFKVYGDGALGRAAPVFAGL